MAVSVNKADLALPLFKAALEANPQVEQFWLSYINALIKEKQFDNAKQVLEQGKKLGVVGEKVDALEEHLTLMTQAPNSTLPEQKKSLTLSVLVLICYCMLFCFTSNAKTMRSSSDSNGIV